MAWMFLGSQFRLTSDLQQLTAAADLISPGPLRTAERAFQIVRYYDKRQILMRLWNTTVGKHLASRPIPDVLQVGFCDGAEERLARLARLRVVRTDSDPTALAADLASGIFTLLGERRVLGTPVDWSGGQQEGTERLWQFHLHYHEYLLDVVTSGTVTSGTAMSGTVTSGMAQAWDVARQLITDWLNAHPVKNANRLGDAWHPYCISRRLPIWLQLLAVSEFDAGLRQRMLTSIAQQAEFLCRHTETDLGGNHLLENARGLAMAGCALDATVGNHKGRQQHWLATAEQILRREMPQQLLAHGEHFERSPMYHCQVLGNLLQIALLTHEVQPALAYACLEWARLMWEFLQSILHPDGEIPLFGDSCFGETFPVTELRQLVAANANVKSPASCDSDSTNPEDVPKSPYWVWRHGEDAWIVDGGAAVTNALPAHGHCDLGGFEASISGVRWFVDGGLYGYSDDSMRQYCRSSLAHNVVTVDDRNQFDVWSRFRMGYRVQPEAFETGQQAEYCWAHSAHHAYRRLGVGKVHRITAAHSNGTWVCVEHIESAARRRVVGRLHLGPCVNAESTDPLTWVLSSAQHRRVLRFSGVAVTSATKSWYSPRFGRRVMVDTIQYEATSDSNVCMGWTLSSAPENEAPTLVFGCQNGALMATLLDTNNNCSCEWKLECERDVH